jgi:hypothetical protein
LYCLDRSSYLSGASYAIECPLASSLAPLPFAEKNRWLPRGRLTHVAGFLNTALTNNSANHLLFPALTQSNVRNSNLMIALSISFVL